jgi:hypothetical protein
MGFKSGLKTFYKIKQLPFAESMVLVHHQKMRRQNDIGNPIVNIDASWVVRQCIIKSYDLRVSMLIRLCLIFVENNCCKNIVFDGTNCHWSKRGTIKWTVDCCRLNVDSFYKKSILLSLSDSLIDANTEDDKALFSSNIGKMKKKIKTMENICQHHQ